MNIENIPANISLAAYDFTNWDCHTNTGTLPKIVTISMTDDTIVYIDTDDNEIKIAQWESHEYDEETGMSHRIIPETIKTMYGLQTKIMTNIIAITCLNDGYEPDSI